MDKILESIYKQIQWYNSTGLVTQNIGELLTCKDRLAVYSYGLAQFSAELKKEYNISYFIYKIEVAKRKQALMVKRKMTATHSETEALLDNEDKYKAQIENEANCYKADILLKQVNVIIQAITQRIAYLRKELDLSNNQNAI